MQSHTSPPLRALPAQALLRETDRQKMAAETLLVRIGVAMEVSLSVVKLTDRLPNGTDTVLQEWCFQRQVEAALYGNGFAQGVQSSGAVYKLLHRSGVGQHTLPLKKASIAAGLITEEEYSWLYSHLGNVRSFSLIPLHAIEVALGVFGCTDRSLAVVAAL